MHVVQPAVGDLNEARDAAAQIEQGVHLHFRLGRTKVRPRKQRQAQIDGGRVESVDRGVEVSGGGGTSWGCYGTFPLARPHPRESGALASVKICVDHVIQPMFLSSIYRNPVRSKCKARV